MSMFDIPSISVGKKSNEENMQAAKAWMIETAERLSYSLSKMEDKITELEQKIERMQGEK